MSDNTIHPKPIIVAVSILITSLNLNFIIIIIVCADVSKIYKKGVEFMGLFLVTSNWVGALCGVYVTYKLARLAFKKDNK